jgi:hypothetical protein
MNKWLQFLVENGARIEEATSAVASFGAAADPIAMKRGFIAPLTDLGLMAFAGEDAAHFLHNQLTNDVEHLGETEARLAGYCSPKGRLLATFLMWKAGEAITLEVSRPIQAATQKRLQMFILRSKVKLVDVTENHAILGLGGEAAASTLRSWFQTVPAAPYAMTVSDAGALIRVADADGVPRYQWITSVEHAMAIWPQLVAELHPAGTALWRLTDIQAGTPQITLDTQDKFVPQMINFEVIGGVNFKKGCYPGQEIVARSQYLGKLKRRMMPALVDSTSARAGMEVFSGADPEQPCGMIVNAELCSPQQMAVLVELKIAALGAAVHLGTADGPILTIQPLPYTLPE